MHITRILAPSTNGNLWWTGFKLMKHLPACNNKSAKSCGTESWRSTSCSEGKLGECSVLVCTEKNLILSIIWCVDSRDHVVIQFFKVYSSGQNTVFLKVDLFLSWGENIGGTYSAGSNRQREIKLITGQPKPKKKIFFFIICSICTLEGT
jgi:hypothetical protein